MGSERIKLVRRGRLRSTAVAASMVVVAAGLGLGATSPARAATGCGRTAATSAAACTFTATGVSGVTVPAWVTTIRIDAVGGAGGGINGVGTGALGAEVIADRSVTPGGQLFAVVGSNGGAAGASSSTSLGSGARGGNGGGASDVRTCTTACPAGTIFGTSTDPRLVVGGGGGGAGGGFVPAGGPGGSGGGGGAAGAGAPGTTTLGQCSGGGPGTAGTGTSGGGFGGGAGCSSGGVGGAAADASHAGNGSAPSGGAAQDAGGAGGAGGGGGAGFFGGGGGAVGFANSGGGGGGGGSSFAKTGSGGPGAGGTTPTFGTAPTTSPSVTISYVPGAPTGVVASPGNGQATVSWIAPADTGGNGILDCYHVAAFFPNGGAPSPAGPPVDVCKGPSTPAPTTATITGLSNGVQYEFQVTAHNGDAASLGDGPPSGFSNIVTPHAVAPGAPLNVTASPGNGQATVMWDPPTSNGGAPITSYTVTSSPGGLTRTVSGSTFVATVTGLTNGTCYSFTVRATNSAGPGPASAPSACVIPQPVIPSAPTNVTATGGNMSAAVSWQPPSNNGGASILSYTVRAYPGPGFSVSESSTPFPGNVTSGTVTGLTNGTQYKFTVSATNSAGEGPESVLSTSAVTPNPVPPGAPGNVEATAGNMQATVSFTPADDGGSPMDHYTITSNPGSITATVDCTVPGDPCGGATISGVVTGLTNGTSYTFTVTATNGIPSTGPASAPSNAVTPSTTPAAPAKPTAVAGNQQATVTWTAPNNGGSPITSYVVTAVGDPSKTATVNCADPGNPCAGPNISATVTGLTNGTPYQFTVTAHNANGDGPPSPASDAVTPGAQAPGAPTGVTAIAGNGLATVSWSAPTVTGSNSIMTYVVTPYTGATFTTAGPTTSFPGTQLSGTVTGLTNGTAYKFTVKAINDASITGPESTKSNAVTPSAPPNLLTQNFNATTSLNGWTITTSPSGAPAHWHRTTSCGPAHASGVDAPYAYFGKTTACNYGDGQVTSSKLISPVISVPTGSNIRFTFMSKRAVRSCSGTCSTDRTQVFADYGDGHGFVHILYVRTAQDPSTGAWESLTNAGGGQLATINSPTGSVRLMFKFTTGTVPPTSLTKYGWGIDDITLSMP